MRTKLLNPGSPAERTWAVVFETDDAVVDGLLRFAEANDLQGAHLTAIGAFREATLYYFDWEAKQYLDIPIDEQVEVLALTGNIALSEKGPKLHAHVVLGTRGGYARGGHLKEARVRPTLEVVVTEEPEHLIRRHDPVTGLALLAP